MYVNPVEVNSATELATTEPKPVFKDDNITVYGIPLQPDHLQQSSVIFENMEVDGEDSIFLENKKRKRSLSPDSSSKRPDIAGIQPGRAVDSNDVIPLLERMHEPGFTPSTLEGKDAQEWRRLMVRTMFKSEPPEKPKTRFKEKGKGKAKADVEIAQAPKSQPTNLTPIAPDTELRSGPGRPRIKHHHHPLPKLALPPLEDKVTLCYVCIGPRQRGKFDVQKAVALGVPRGPLRGRLTKGETITFMVDDGSDGKVERTVTPEDVVGPSEAPKVMSPLVLNL